MDILFLIPVVTISKLICTLYPFENQKHKRYTAVTAFVIVSLVLFGIWLIYSDGLVKTISHLSITGIDLIDGFIEFVLILFLCLAMLVFVGIFYKISSDESYTFALHVMATVKYSGGKYTDCNFRVFRKIYTVAENDAKEMFSRTPTVDMCKTELAELIIIQRPAIIKRFYNLSPSVQTAILLMRSMNSKEKDELDYSCYVQYNPSKDMYDHYVKECVDYCLQNLPKTDKFVHYLISNQ